MLFRIGHCAPPGVQYQKDKTEAVEGQYCRMEKITVVDIFCGCGGASTGIMNAAKYLDRDIQLIAVDQSRPAIETHEANHPGVRHICMPVENVNLSEIDHPYLLWASPPCTDHSVARGARPKSSASQGLAWEAIRWIKELHPEIVLVENVLGFLGWGPLGHDGRPIRSRAGETFLQFVAALESFGYRVDWKILCAADYGDPTSRRRLFIQAIKRCCVPPGGIRWPAPTHSEHPDMFTARRWRSARDIIDWSIRGVAISRRRKHLSENTIKRIESGIRKYWREAAEPFLISLRGTSPAQIKGSPESIARPLRTVSAGGIHEALIEPFLLRYTSEDNRHASIHRPIGTLDTSPRYALIGGNPDEIAVTHRMLQPHELAAAQGFPPDYHFCGTQTDVIKQIGNAVPVNTAAALCRAALEGIQ